MYPFLTVFRRALFALAKSRVPLGARVTQGYICMPWDLDHWGEMNHGRVLTLSDVVLPGAAVRSGLMQLVLHKGWALTMAGATCRWRHRIRPFMRLTFAQRLVGWDAKFVYLEVTVWHKGTAMAQTLYRAAVRSPRGTIAPQTLIDALAGAEGGVSAHGMDLGQTPDSFAQDGTPPAWVRAWTEAEAQRPWPPEAIS